METLPTTVPLLSEQPTATAPSEPLSAYSIFFLVFIFLTSIVLIIIDPLMTICISITATATLCVVYRYKFASNTAGALAGADANISIQSYGWGFGPGLVLVIIAELAMISLGSLIIALFFINDSPSTVHKPKDVVIILSSTFYFMWQCFMVAGFCEETLKYWIAVRATRLRPVMLTNSRQFVFYAFLGALGFSTMENLKYGFQVGRYSAVSMVFISVLRLVFSMPLHVLTGSCIGVKVVECKVLTGREGWRRYVYTLKYPVLVHGMFNFVLMFLPYVAENYVDFGEFPVGLFCFFLDVGILISFKRYVKREYKRVVEEIETIEAVQNVV